MIGWIKWSSQIKQSVAVCTSVIITLIIRVWAWWISKCEISNIPNRSIPLRAFKHPFWYIFRAQCHVNLLLWYKNKVHKQSEWISKVLRNVSERLIQCTSAHHTIRCYRRGRNNKTCWVIHSHIRLNGSPTQIIWKKFVLRNSTTYNAQYGITSPIIFCADQLRRTFVHLKVPKNFT